MPDSNTPASSTPSVTATPTEAPSQTPTAPVDASKSPEAPKPTETPAQAIARRFKVKIDGAESEVDEEELLRGYQTTRAAQKRFSEAAEREKKVAAMLERLKEDPEGVLTDPEIGVDVQSLAEKILTRRLEEEILTPEQKEMRDLRAKLASIEKEKQKALEAEEKKRHEAAVEKFKADFTSMCDQVITMTKLPRSKKVVSRVIDAVEEVFNSGSQLSPDVIARMVKEDFEGDTKAVFGELTGEALLNLLSPEAIQAIRVADAKKATNIVPPPPAEQPKPDATKVASKKLSAKEYYAKKLKDLGE